MDQGKRGYAVMSFVFLLLYGGTYGLLLLLFGGPVSFSPKEVLGLVFLLLPAVAALFLMLRRHKAAAVLMTLALVWTLIGQVPEIPRYLEPNGYLATYNEAIGYTEYIPRGYVVLPILNILAAACFSAALYLRGRPALILALLSALAEQAYMVLNMAATAYVTGHPTPFFVFFPFNYAMGALFAGLYLYSLRRKSQSKKDPGDL